MALQGSGTISFNQIRAEFGNGQNRLGQYRRDDSSFTNKSPGTFSNLPLDTNVPTSGTIKFSDFYNKKLNIVVDCHSGSNETRGNARTKYNASPSSTGNSSGNWNVVGGYANAPSDSNGKRVYINVNKTYSATSDCAEENTTRVALHTGSWQTGTELSVDVGGEGKIVGAGGKGGGGGEYSDDGDGGQDGSHGLGIAYGTDANETVVNVASGGMIVCGFGGGGGGGGARQTDGDEDHRASGGGGGGGAGHPAGEGGDGGDGGQSNGQGGENGSTFTLSDINANVERAGEGGDKGSYGQATGAGIGGEGRDYESAGTGGPSCDQTECGEGADGPYNSPHGEDYGSQGGDAGEDGQSIRCADPAGGIKWNFGSNSGYVHDVDSGENEETGLANN